MPNEQRAKRSEFDSPFDWIMQQQNENDDLTNRIESLNDKNLVQHLIHSIDGENDSNEKTACIKLLLCKSEPIIWGMQRSVSKRINVEEDSDDERVHGVAAFFQHMPSIEHFKEHGNKCNERFKMCKT